MYFSQSLGAARAIRGDVGGDPDVVGEGGNEVEETVFSILSQGVDVDVKVR